MRDDMHAGRIKPEEERLAVLPCLVEEPERVRQYFIINCLHTFWTEFACILDSLLPDLAPARFDGGVILVRRVAVDHVARADAGLERRRYWPSRCRRP